VHALKKYLHLRSRFKKNLLLCLRSAQREYRSHLTLCPSMILYPRFQKWTFYNNYNVKKLYVKLRNLIFNLECLDSIVIIKKIIEIMRDLL